MTSTADIVEHLRSADEGDVSARLAALDIGDAATVPAVLQAFQEIAEEFVVPAAPLLSQENDDWSYFDLEDLAGYAYPGLIGGLLTREFPQLTPPPADGVLAERLETAGFDIDDPARRLRFFRGWMALRASTMLDRYVDFLGRADTALSGDAVETLERLARLPLRGATRSRVVELLAAVAPDRARLLLDDTQPAYLVQLLTKALSQP